MDKKTISTILAYVGILTGAGLASGQEIIQYFIGFGFKGLVLLLVVGILHFLLGGILLQLGSYYHASSHDDVLDEVAGDKLSSFFDYSLIATCFIFGFVMIAGAGSSLNQEFGIKTWIGSLVCTLMIIVIGMMDIDKVTRIIASFTPAIVVFVVLAGIYSVTTSSFDFKRLEILAQTLTRNIENPYLATVNYFSMCIMSAISMAFVLGGNNLDSERSRKGGMLGGLLVGIIGFIVGLSLYLKIELVKDADIPVQIIVKQIHPYLGTIMSIIIYGMIFNTAISLFYALARRFSGDGDEAKFRRVLVGLTLGGFAISFLGFKKLVGIFYPIIGYIGMVLVCVLAISWIKEKSEIDEEAKIRKKIYRLLNKKVKFKRWFSTRDQKKLDKLLKDSVLDDEEVRQAMKEEVHKDIENLDESEKKTLARKKARAIKIEESHKEDREDGDNLEQ